MTEFAVPGDAELTCAEVMALKRGGGHQRPSAPTRGSSTPHGKETGWSAFVAEVPLSTSPPEEGETKGFRCLDLGVQTKGFCSAERLESSWQGSESHVNSSALGKKSLCERAGNVSLLAQHLQFSSSVSEARGALQPRHAEGWGGVVAEKSPPFHSAFCQSRAAWWGSARARSVLSCSALVGRGSQSGIKWLGIDKY